MVRRTPTTVLRSPRGHVSCSLAATPRKGGVAVALGAALLPAPDRFWRMARPPGPHGQILVRGWGPGGDSSDSRTRAARTCVRWNAFRGATTSRGCAPARAKGKITRQPALCRRLRLIGLAPRPHHRRGISIPRQNLFPGGNPCFVKRCSLYSFSHSFGVPRAIQRWQSLAR